MRPLPLLSVCLIIASQPAFAGIWSPDTDRILGDPAYLTSAGQVFGEASYSYTEGQSQRKSETQIPFFSDQPPTFSNKSDSNNFLPSLSYGLTDDLSVSANLGFGNTRTSQTYAIQYYTFFGAVRHGGLVPFPIGPITFPMPRLVTVHIDDYARSIGANDPGFGLTWRAIDERRAPVNVDLTVSYAPDIFQAHGSGYETTGTQAFGGQRASASVAVSRELHLLTVAAFGTFTYEGRSDFGSGNVVDRSGAHPAYAGGVQSQIRLLPFLALNTGQRRPDRTLRRRDDLHFRRRDLPRFGDDPARPGD